MWLFDWIFQWIWSIEFLCLFICGYHATTTIALILWCVSCGVSGNWAALPFTWIQPSMITNYSKVSFNPYVIVLDWICISLCHSFSPMCVCVCKHTDWDLHINALITIVIRFLFFLVLFFCSSPLLSRVRSLCFSFFVFHFIFTNWFCFPLIQ